MQEVGGRNVLLLHFAGCLESPADSQEDFPEGTLVQDLWRELCHVSFCVKDVVFVWHEVLVWDEAGLGSNICEERTFGTESEAE